ncbi:glycoside hydrolase family 36 protein [Anaerosporobacter sp.]|uniref:glycoside hydrolase family 36 protein n=1 Tax=Anaerosporobacter sp. TaxID=1872529 RepID=UPI00286F52CB|nr:alpha-galactosidase [Anaerosporobacter sp.]
MQEKNYVIENTLLKYLINENKQVSLLLVPQSQARELKQPWDTEQTPAAPNPAHNKEWRMGSLVQLHLRHHSRCNSGGNSMKYSESVRNLQFASQDAIETADSTKIITTLTATEGYKVLHTLTHQKGQTAFSIETTFVNESNHAMTLEMLSSFSLDNISPFQEDDAPNKITLHRFKGGWSLEGKHISEPIETLSLEKSWASAFVESERFGVIGSWPVGRFFPMALLEDTEHQVLWGAQICHNASWQMEVTRFGDTLSLSGGLPDMDFGSWFKTIQPQESFSAPVAYITTHHGDYSEACQSITKLHNIAADQFGEEGLPIIFNEWCTTWGTPTHENMLSYAEKFKGHPVKYLVIDAGWSKTNDHMLGQAGNGDWIVDTTKFPNIKDTTTKLREKGYIPGIWFEFEVTTKGAQVYENEYDDWHLKRDGIVINCDGWRTFWDFRNPKVTAYLTEKIIMFLKENGFGYLKVDYNGSIGLGCDGCDSLGEGLRTQMEAVRLFFMEIKRQIPDIIIENCASGGHRLEPSMLGVTAMSSFSDAHECVEIPYIAANLHYLILPRQSQIWAVLHSTDTDTRLCYSLSATFLGRMCLSGDINNLSEHQWDLVKQSEDFYTSVAHIIKDGISKIYGERSLNMRYPEGTQAVIRTYEDELLIICHSFENPNESMQITLSSGAYTIQNAFNNKYISITGNVLTIAKMDCFEGCAVHVIKATV